MPDAAAGLGLTRPPPRGPPLDRLWEGAARHLDEVQLGALVLSIAGINLWNRVDVTTRQVAGQGW